MIFRFQSAKRIIFAGDEEKIQGLSFGRDDIFPL